MVQNQSNIVLIGMPGSGKSTVGIILAKMISRDFVDTDVIIQISQGRNLQDIVNMEGHMVLRQIEEDILLSLKCFNHVIATGGSVVYSHPAMKYLKSQVSSFSSMWICLYWNQGFIILKQGALQGAQTRLSRICMKNVATYI